LLTKLSGRNVNEIININIIPDGYYDKGAFSIIVTKRESSGFKNILIYYIPQGLYFNNIFPPYQYPAP